MARTVNHIRYSTWCSKQSLSSCAKRQLILRPDLLWPKKQFNREITTRHVSEGYLSLRFALRESRGYIPTLSPAQVRNILEYTEDILDSPSPGFHAVKSFHSNQLASNSPVEDRRVIGQLQKRNASLFAVLDGHAGPACAQSVSERLFDYIAVATLNLQQLEEYMHLLKASQPAELVQYFPFFNTYTNEGMQQFYNKSIQKFVVESLSLSDMEEYDVSIKDALSNAYAQLDNDISSEALPSPYAPVNKDSVEIALSGACALTVYVENCDVFVANSGDSRAVLGSWSENEEWIATPLSFDHNSDNPAEVQRLKETHPVNEHITLLKNGRLLGQLSPLRAFGDVRYKWSAKDLKNISSLLGTSVYTNLVPPFYHSPPYLSTKPEITHHKLKPGDKFLILATDGLWETMSNSEAVELVGNHMDGKSTEVKFEITDTNTNLKNLNDTLRKRKNVLKNKPLTLNSATHLIRHGLGPEHRKISEMLTLPPDAVRHYRDDITAIIIYFDQDYLEKECD